MFSKKNAMITEKIKKIRQTKRRNAIDKAFRQIRNNYRFFYDFLNIHSIIVLFLDFRMKL